MQKPRTRKPAEPYDKTDFQRQKEARLREGELRDPHRLLPRRAEPLPPSKTAKPRLIKRLRPVPLSSTLIDEKRRIEIKPKSIRQRRSIIKHSSLKRRPFPITHRLPNEVVAPSPFNIISKREMGGYRLYRTAPIFLSYGKTQMWVSGRELNIQDQSVFIALTQLAVKYKSLGFRISLSELCHLLHKKSYGQTSKDSIEHSLRRLREVEIRMVWPEENAWHVGGVIYYAAEKNNQYAVHLNQFFARLFGNELLTSIDPQYRLSIKGDVAKQLYLFFQRQVSAKSKQKSTKYRYGPIDLETLCRQIGLDRDRKLELSELRYRIGTALNELKEIEYLHSFIISKKDKIWVIIKTPKEPEPSSEVERLPMPKLDNLLDWKPKPAQKEKEPKEPLENDLVTTFEKMKGFNIPLESRSLANDHLHRIQIIDKLTRSHGKEDGLTVYYGEPLLERFTEWLGKEEQSWIEKIHVRTLDPYGKIFSMFMKENRFKIPNRIDIEMEFQKVKI